MSVKEIKIWIFLKDNLFREELIQSHTEQQTRRSKNGVLTGFYCVHVDLALINAWYTLLVIYMKKKGG